MGFALCLWSGAGESGGWRAIWPRAGFAEPEAGRTPRAGSRPSWHLARSCSLDAGQRRRPKYRVPVSAPTLRALSAAKPTVIAPEGELARVGDFRAALSDAAREGAAAVVVDLSQVSFIDSSGLGALVELHNRLRRSGRRLAVVAPGGSASAVLLSLAGLRERLPISDTRGAALDT